AKAEAEEAKIGVRNDRKNANNEIKDLDISEDLKKNLEIDIQQMTDTHITKIEEILARKEKEIMTV
ncbi:MAG: ribosome recycling factor, partial [Altibacter sp.]|nr:ribosome recycling factor [Altibacter sp.]